MDRPRATIALAALAVALITVSVDWPCVRNSFTFWDDDLYLREVERHPQLNWTTVKWAFTATQPFYYQPLTWISLVLDHQLWGRNPAGPHAISLLLHALNAALVVAFVWSLLKAVPTISDGERGTLATLVGLLFTLHPIQVESVAWYAERKTVLCATFALGSLWAYVEYAQQAQRRVWWWTALGLGAAAMLTKPMAVSLPVVMLAADYYPLRRQMALGWRRLILEKLPWFVMGIVLSVVTVIAQTTAGAVMELEKLSPALRLLVAVRGVIFYLWKLVWPAWLSPYYPLGGKITLAQAEYWVPTAAFIVVTLLLVRWRRRVPALIAGWVAYLAWLLPVSGLFQSGAQAVADRFAYLSIVPVFLLMVGGGLWLWRKTQRPVRIALVALIVGELLFWTVRSRQQIVVWRNEENVWLEVLARFPGSGVANLHYAAELASQQRFHEALPHAEIAVDVFPDTGLGHSTLGLIWLKLGDPVRALHELQDAIRRDPKLVAPRYNLACAYARLGKPAEAYDTLQELARIDPQMLSFAARDSEFAVLRENPDYADRFHRLINSAGK
jgi:protein O-mannosyl-transferase